MRFRRLESLIFLKRKAKEAEPQPCRIVEVYKWAGMMTAESHAVDEKDYYWSKRAKTIRFKTRNSDTGSLIGVVGLQGTGKSSLLAALAARFHSKETPTLLFMWTKDAVKNYKEWLHDHSSDYFESATFKLEQLVRLREIRLPYNVTFHDLTEARDARSRLPMVERLLGRTKVKELLEETFYASLGYGTTFLFIDLPDYSKATRAAMNKDLSDIEAMWKSIIEKCEARCPVIVLGIQKEMAMKNPHFFLGKFELVELTPLEPQELVEAYQLKWNNCNPFTQDSLLLIAELSRGVFRRFLKYIRIVIEEFSAANAQEPITTEFIRKTISFEQLLKDMDLELSDVFKKREDKALTVKILLYLREAGPSNQKTIAQDLGVTEMRLGRFMETLEAYGYIKRQRGKRKEIICSLA